MTAEKIVTLHPVERVQQDAEPIASLYRDLGTTSAEQVVTRALTELGLTMAALNAQVRARDLDALARRLRKLQSMAENLGLVSLARVAQDLRICLGRSDATAFSAVWARLIRIAERSLAPDRDLLDRSLH
ncbi:MAG: hypothetical protein MUF74_01955 [Cypionkella sp.]|jgi:HPt (histidine-containing phosphotransfer) domain-containing protein|nr:hypothetical protein [Cypionkella sp.]